MALAMPAGIVSRFRNLWAGRLIDDITITRTTDRGNINTTTLVYDSPSTVTVYNGKALIRPRGASQTDDGAGYETQAGLWVYVPATLSTSPLPRDTLVINTAALDQALAGATLTIVAFTVDSYATRRRIDAIFDEGTGNPDDGT